MGTTGILTAITPIIGRGGVRDTGVGVMAGDIGAMAVGIMGIQAVVTGVVVIMAVIMVATTAVATVAVEDQAGITVVAMAVQEAMADIAVNLL